MRSGSPDTMVYVAIDDVRNHENATYFVTEGGVYQGEKKRKQLSAYLKAKGFPEDRLDTIISVVHNFHGVMINSVTKEFKGKVIEIPDLMQRHPEIASKVIGTR